MVALAVGSAIPSTASAAKPASAFWIGTSLARAPTPTSRDAPTRTVAVVRASLLVASPWYQITVFVEAAAL